MIKLLLELVVYLLLRIRHHLSFNDVLLSQLLQTWLPWLLNLRTTNEMIQVDLRWLNCRPTAVHIHLGVYYLADSNLLLLSCLLLLELIRMLLRWSWDCNACWLHFRLIRLLLSSLKLLMNKLRI